MDGKIVEWFPKEKKYSSRFRYFEYWPNNSASKFCRPRVTKLWWVIPMFVGNKLLKIIYRLKSSKLITWEQEWEWSWFVRKNITFT